MNALSLVFTSIAGFTVGLHALLYIRFRLSKDIVSHWTVLVHLLTEIKSRPPETAMTRRLKGIMTVQRITQAESFALLFAHLMSICVLVITANYIAYGYCSWLSDVQTWLAVVVLMVAMVTYLLPSVLTEYRIAFWYHGMMAWCAVMPIFTIDYGSLLYTSAGLLIFRLALGLMFMDALRATLWNIVYLACTCYRFVQLAPLSDDKIDWRMYFMGEIALCVILSLLDFGAARASLRLAQQTIEAQAYESASRATRGLLDTFCDVTIDLDDQHTIIGDCHALAAMLMHGTVVSLKGRKLQEFMANKQDQDQYEGQLSFGSFRVDGPAVKSMSIRMKDGCGGILASEMFKTSYLGMCGELRHLVGIREFADAPPLFPMRQRPSFTGRKRQNSMENKGTPSILGKESLPEKHYTSETESSEIGSEMCADEDLAIPELSRTSDEATRWILERAMAQVNWKLAESNCCRYHGYVRELKQFIKRLNKKVCCPHFADNADDFFQCETCGLLSYAEEAECASGKVKCLACSSNSFLSFPTSNEPALSPLTSL